MNTKTKPKSLSLHMPWAGISFHFQTRKCTTSMLHWGAISEEKSLFSHCAGPRHALMEFRKDDTRLKYSDGHLMNETINIGSRTSQLKPKITLEKCAANHAQDTCASEAPGGSPYCHTPRVSRILTIRKEVDIAVNVKA